MMSVVRQLLHFEREPVTSGLRPTPAMSPRRATDAMCQQATLAFSQGGLLGRFYFFGPIIQIGGLSGQPVPLSGHVK